jgi:hypothetical protein
MKMKKIILIISAVCASALIGCENEVEPGGTPVMKLSNEWWVRLLVEDGSGGYDDAYDLGYLHFLTSSTASNSADSILMDDFNEVIQLKAKVACNVSDLTFGNGTTAVNERYTDGTVIINNGKIFERQGLSSSGVEVDSIYFEAEFDWDLGQVYIIAGHGRTGFPEDQH